MNLMKCFLNKKNRKLIFLKMNNMKTINFNLKIFKLICLKDQQKKIQ